MNLVGDVAIITGGAVIDFLDQTISATIVYSNADFTCKRGIIAACKIVLCSCAVYIFFLICVTFWDASDLDQAVCVIISIVAAFIKMVRIYAYLGSAYVSF